MKQKPATKKLDKREVNKMVGWLRTKFEKTRSRRPPPTTSSSSSSSSS